MFGKNSNRNFCTDEITIQLNDKKKDGDSGTKYARAKDV